MGVLLREVDRIIKFPNMADDGKWHGLEESGVV